MRNLAQEFAEFHQQYHDLFELGTRSVVIQSRHYLFGLIQAQRKNMARIVEAVPGTNWQSLHHYTSDSPWDAFAVMDRIGTDADSVIGNDPDSCLIVDESGFTKRGTKSVGVARQWNGRLGKVDNCQVGVYLALNCREQVTLTDTRLFLPQEWTNSKRRCQQAGVPKDRYQQRKKTELALGDD